MASLTMAYLQRSGWFDLPGREKNDGTSSLKTQCCSANEGLGKVKTESTPAYYSTCCASCLSVL